MRGTQTTFGVVWAPDKNPTGFRGPLTHFTEILLFRLPEGPLTFPPFLTDLTFSGRMRHLFLGLDCLLVLSNQMTATTTTDAPTTTQPSNDKKKIASSREYGGDDDGLLYKSGIPTLRSSAHRVKFDVKRRKHDPKPTDRHGKETHTTWLPDALLEEDVFSYDLEKYDLKGSILSLLQSCDESIVGSFETTKGVPPTLEDFRVPIPSIWRSVNGGCCESAQKYLSDRVASNTQFLELFERFVEEVALPYFKQRLIATGAIQEEDPTLQGPHQVAYTSSKIGVSSEAIS